MTVPKSILLFFASSATAFTSNSLIIKSKASNGDLFLVSAGLEIGDDGFFKATTSVNDADEKSIFDPLQLYGESTMERKKGLIRSLEPELKVIKPVIDPLNIYLSKEEVDVDMSTSLPFMPRPTSLTGELVGDVGFDPFNFADTEEKLLWQREAELKHSRIAMLAVIGWPVSELLDRPLAQMFHLDPLLGSGDRVPSILNGGLDRVNPLYWVFVLAIASSVELLQMNRDDATSWDPLGLYPEDTREQNQLKQVEIDNGRLAMLGITGFAIQEFFTNTAVMEPLLPAHF